MKLSVKSSVSEYRKTACHLNVVDLEFSFKIEVTAEDLALFEKNPDNWLKRQRHHAINGAKELRAAIWEAQKVFNDDTVCHRYHSVTTPDNIMSIEEIADEIFGDIKSAAWGYYDTQMLYAAFVVNPGTYPGFTAREIHPNAVVVDVPRTMADVRKSYHPMGRGCMSQW